VAYVLDFCFWGFGLGVVSGAYDRGFKSWTFALVDLVCGLCQGAYDHMDYVLGSFALEGFGLTGLRQMAFKG